MIYTTRKLIEIKAYIDVLERINALIEDTETELNECSYNDSVSKEHCQSLNDRLEVLKDLYERIDRENQ